MGPPKVGAGGGWRQRALEREKQALPAAASPAAANTPLPDLKKDAEGFEPVPAKQAWRSKRVQNQS